MAVGRFPWRCESMSPPNQRLRSGPVIGKSFAHAARQSWPRRPCHGMELARAARQRPRGHVVALLGRVGGDSDGRARSPVASNGRFANNRRADPGRPAAIAELLRVDSCSSLGAANEPPRRGELAGLPSFCPYPIAEPSRETV